MKQHLMRAGAVVAWLVCTGATVQAADTATTPKSSRASTYSTETATDAAAMSGNVVAPPTATIGSSLATTDRAFVNKAVGGGMYEVQASELAGQKTSDPAVRDFAAMLVTQHTDANNKLKQLAISKGMALSTKLPRDKQAALDKLSKANGAAFDREYIRTVGLAAHMADITMFENASRNARDSELKAWIDKTLPTLRDHLAQAQKINVAGMDTATQGNAMKMPSGASAGATRSTP